MKTTKYILFTGLVATLFFTACKKDDDKVNTPPPVANEPEVITTMRLTFVDSSNSSNVFTATFRDPDGDGGLSYDIFDTIRLAPNKTWYTSVVLLNETVNPVDSISNEVLGEANDHLLCFFPSGNSANVTITDADGNGLPLGLQSKWRTTSTGLGTMNIQLHHQPGIKNGSDCSLGNTDIDVTFPTKIE